MIKHVEHGLIIAQLNLTKLKITIESDYTNIMLVK
jgi:hypothetical protein